MEAAAPVPKSVSLAPLSGIRRGLSSGTVALLVVAAAAGAASQADGVLVGIPAAAQIALALLAAAWIWVSRATGLGGFLLPAVVGFAAGAFGPSGSSFLLFTGRPLFAFVMAGMFLAVIAFGRKPSAALLFPVLFTIYSGVAYQAQTRVGPEGDEPQYLMVAESLIRDHDLALDQDFKERRFEAFSSHPLEPHFRVRGREGQIYSLHSVGLSVLILPAYALLGYAGASFFMAFLAALLVRELRRLLMNLTGDPNLAEGTAWLVGLSPPIIHFAGLIFTEIPAALLLCTGLRTAIYGRTSRAVNVAALCAAALPWLNVRYAILSLAIAGAIFWRLGRDPRSEGGTFARPRPFLVPASLLIGSAAAIGLYHFSLWGFFDPRRVYGRTREFSLAILPEGLPGLFFDQEFGLFVYAPLFVLSLPGLVLLWRRQRSLLVVGLFAALGVIATASVWPMWRGGFNPPARFLVPLVPILAASLALTLERGVRPSTALLAGWGLWCGLGGALSLETIHRDRDGVAPFFRTQSGAREWTAALPSFVLSEDRPTRVLVWPWAALLAAPVLLAAARKKAPARALRNRDTLMTAAAFMAAAVFADQTSPRARSPEREATRLLGVPSLSLPSLRYQASTPAAWRLDLFYEPHRSPSGLTFAAQVPLRAGSYELVLATRDRLSPGSMPLVECRDRATGTSQKTVAVAAPDGLHAVLGISRDGTYDLLLGGGTPATFFEARLVRVR